MPAVPEVNLFQRLSRTSPRGWKRSPTAPACLASAGAPEEVCSRPWTLGRLVPRRVQNLAASYSLEMCVELRRK